MQVALGTQLLVLYTAIAERQKGVRGAGGSARPTSAMPSAVGSSAGGAVVSATAGEREGQG